MIDCFINLALFEIRLKERLILIIETSNTNSLNRDKSNISLLSKDNFEDEENPEDIVRALVIKSLVK